MKRHETLIPLTHDHHHVLKEVRHLKIATRGDATERLVQARAFLSFFDSDGVEHFRQEEDSVFPLVAGREEARESLTQALAEHGEIRMLVEALRVEVGRSDVRSERLLAVATKLEGHVRLEEKTLFPLIERLVSDHELRSIGVGNDVPTGGSR